MNQLDLADTVIVSMEDMTQQVINHYDNQTMDDATAIINEWTLPNNVCVLTKYIQDDTESIEDEFPFVTTIDGQLGYGSFTFDDESELPVDNN